MRKSIFTVLAAMTAAVVLGDITGSVTTENGDVHKGTIRWSVRDRAFAVTTKGGIEIQVKPADVAELNVDKPKGFDEAVEQVQKGQAAAALPTLQSIVKGYAHMQWDKVAGRYLAEAYVASGKAEEGLRACQDIISSDSSAAYKGELAPAYWEALLALGKRPQLESALEKAIKSGDRFSSGAALIKRGDIILKDGGDSTEAARKALIDGYLRVVLLYRDPEVAPRLQPEALYKAGNCFEKLSSSGRAESMRAQLKQQYGTSPWAQK